MASNIRLHYFHVEFLIKKASLKMLSENTLILYVWDHWNFSLKVTIAANHVTIISI